MTKIDVLIHQDKWNIKHHDKCIGCMCVGGFWVVLSNFIYENELFRYILHEWVVYRWYVCKGCKMFYHESSKGEIVNSVILVLTFPCVSHEICILFSVFVILYVWLIIDDLVFYILKYILICMFTWYTLHFRDLSM